MILKSISCKSSPRNVLTYLFKKESKLYNEKHKPMIIRHNVRSRTLDKWVKEYSKNESYRLHKRKDNVKAYHTLISFSNKDKELINEKMLRDTAKQYMKLRGDRNLYIGTAHYDKDHIHLHLVMSGTKYLTGESNRLSRAEFHQLKIALDAWQQKKFPELLNSRPAHGRSREAIKAHQTVKTPLYSYREPLKGQLLKTLEHVYSTSKSLDDFINHLKKAGHEPYYRAGRLTGVKFEGGLKFRLNNLGYDKDKIAQLDLTRIKEEKQLSDLRNLRENSYRDRGRDMDQDSAVKEKENDEEREDNRYDLSLFDDINKETERDQDDDDKTEHDDSLDIDDID